MTDALDAFAALTEDERAKLIRLHNGSRYVGRARNQLGDFADEHGWDTETLNDVLRLLAHTPT